MADLRKKTDTGSLHDLEASLPLSLSLYLNPEEDVFWIKLNLFGQ